MFLFDESQHMILNTRYPYLVGRVSWVTLTVGSNWFGRRSLFPTLVLVHRFVSQRDYVFN